MRTEAEVLPDEQRMKWTISVFMPFPVVTLSSSKERKEGRGRKEGRERQKGKAKQGRDRESPALLSFKRSFLFLSSSVFKKYCWNTNHKTVSIRFQFPDYSLSIACLQILPGIFVSKLNYNRGCPAPLRILAQKVPSSLNSPIFTETGYGLWETWNSLQKPNTQRGGNSNRRRAV